MSADFTKEDIIRWREVIYNPDNELDRDISDHWTKYRKIFIYQIARYLYEDMRRARMLITTPFTFNKEFNILTPEEKQVWYNYASSIPDKLRSLDLMIRPYSDFCRTCIITDKEIEKLACIDHGQYFGKHASSVPKNGGNRNLKRKNSPVLVTFQNLPGARKWYFKELNYLIPPQLKKIGFEIIRPDEASEIDTVMLKKLARAIHSRYLQEMRSRDAGDEKDMKVKMFTYPGETDNIYPADFENLPDDIKYSNKDNAYHIPTKLLSIGFKIRLVQKGFKPLALHLNDAEIETMAGVEHLRWSWDKRLNGWIYGNVKDISNKTHPGLIAYEELAESEKEKDRELVRLIPALLQDIDYEAYPINPDRIRKLSYAIKPQSSIHKLLNETRQLNDEIKNLASSCPELDEKVRVINKKIEETISEVQGNYTYAQHIQETFLPDDLFVRECFPDSFILFKPKDIVSGDFYFFSNLDNLIIFAAADCTGHGIPGALLTTIGYGITDQAVNEIKLTDPSEILEHLYTKVHRFLRVEEDGSGLSDDMDIILCTLDIRNNMLTYSGVKNPLYRVSDGKIFEYRPKNNIQNQNGNSSSLFSSEKIQLNKGDTLYLGSDGYSDQFGGKNHKKYLSSRFKSFVLSIQEYSMPEQNDKLYEEIEQWREENNEDQTDDILLIGIRI
jgi:serine phosphatase RsbU (regulator of sigma subunit)